MLACEASEACRDVPFGTLLSPLVVETDGTVVPMQYGFPRRYALGNLRAERLQVLMDRWRATRWRAFRTLCEDAFADATSPARLPFVNWYELVARRGERMQAVPGF
jgi:hypothetical protein